MTTDDVRTYRRRRYEQPPVVEAYARAHFSEPLIWDLTTPGRLYERLHSPYPAPPQARNAIEAQLTPQESGANFELRSNGNQLVFSTEDGTRLIMIEPNSVSVHCLPPYDGYEEIETRLFDLLPLLQGLFGNSAFTFAGASLRYINRIELPVATLKFEEFLTISYTLPPGFPQQLTAFLDRAEVAYPGEDTRLAFTWASTEAPAGSSAFIVDLELTYQKDIPSFDHLKSILKDLKLKETRAFESLLQDGLRKVFREIDS